MSSQKAPPASETQASPASARKVSVQVRSAKKPIARRNVAGRRRKVFVVHGRNEELRSSMFMFLRSLNLEPIEWRKAIAAAGTGTPSVAEILDAAFEQAVAVVVLLSPDDDVILKKEFRKLSDPAYERRYVGQARANVLFEAGMVFGRYPTETVIVQVGVVKPFSDFGGRHVTRLGNDPESRSEFVPGSSTSPRTPTASGSRSGIASSRCGRNSFTAPSAKPRSRKWSPSLPGTGSTSPAPTARSR